jgi:hypothetical protein
VTARWSNSTKQLLDRLEQKRNNVPHLFQEIPMRALVEEAAALASLALFLGMIAVWAQVIAVL